MASLSAGILPLALTPQATPSKIIMAIAPAVSSVEDLAKHQYSSEDTAFWCALLGVSLILYFVGHCASIRGLIFSSDGPGTSCDYR